MNRYFKNLQFQLDFVYFIQVTFQYINLVVAGNVLKSVCTGSIDFPTKRDFASAHLIVFNVKLYKGDDFEYTFKHTEAVNMIFSPYPQFQHIKIYEQIPNNSG